MTMYNESLRAFLKPVLPYMDDEAVSEIMINGPTDIWIERKGRLTKVDASFTEEGLIGAARNMAQFVGRMLNEERPRLDARLPDGSRIHVVIPPIARKGTTISIRKFFKEKLTVNSLMKFGSLTPQMARLIEAGIATKLNMLVAGGTGSGKTTLLNIVSSLIPDEERILTIEDSAELQLNQSHVVPFESRPPDKFGKGAVDMGDLLHSALRLRPDRIVVGEVRGGEAFHLMQAMNTGHGGSLATTHANTPTDTLRRIESLCLMSGVELPMVAVRAQVASAINFIICCERLHDGSRKTIALSEVLPLNEKGDYRTQDIFVFTPVTKDEDDHILGYHAPTGIIPNFVSKARAYGFNDLDESFFDPATYGLPPPPTFHAGEAYSVRWAPSLKHRESGTPDPAHFKSEWAAFEQRLKQEARDVKAGKAAAAPPPPAPASPPVQVQVPASHPTPPPSARVRPPEPPPAAKPAAQAARPPAAPPRPPPAPMDDDATPPPTRNPFADAPDETRTAAAPIEAKVEVSEDLLAEDDGPRTVPPRRPPPFTPPARAPSPNLASGARPAPGARRPAPSRSAEDEEEDTGGSHNANGGSEKTQIRPPPSERPRR
ncbi:Type II/IV secretion system ATP hydrolase TadA/VirB11/CpaF, TadA subfamily [Myxococcus hansupus]|uniref:Type II/IV secretion system ATP hydrolase TadA/VirB11/CpaF, TadA subfamily n=1 Tax=Pseudomyxococcus hansupus TaxID=1297742 RepID=A0A0H4XM22_9BACT|nr:CpaF family protein [Myxococcus hansupus]AKQ69332.1 Type II/IV secretion system ATP hydrolase TadA/VirB11/CpaF, TadA subfamily [Myxococcus hansupus]